MTILFPTEHQKTLVVAEVKPKCLKCAVSGWVDGHVSPIHFGYLGDSHPHYLVYLNQELPRILFPTVVLSELSETAPRLKDELSKIPR